MDQEEAGKWRKMADELMEDLQEATDLIIKQQGDIKRLMEERDRLISVMTRMADVSKKQDAMLQQFYPATKV